MDCGNGATSRETSWGGGFLQWRLRTQTSRRSVKKKQHNAARKCEFRGFLFGDCITFHSGDLGTSLDPVSDVLVDPEARQEGGEALCQGVCGHHAEDVAGVEERRGAGGNTFDGG